MSDDTRGLVVDRFIKLMYLTAAFSGAPLKVNEVIEQAFDHEIMDRLDLIFRECSSRLKGQIEALEEIQIGDQDKLIADLRKVVIKIDEQLPPFRPPTAVQLAEANWKRHKAGDGMVAVTGGGPWPKIFEAFEIISHDGGCGAGHESYQVPLKYFAKMDEWEKFLSPYDTDSDEFRAIVMGSDHEGEMVIDKLIAEHPVYEGLNMFFNAFFEDWEE